MIGELGVKIYETSTKIFNKTFGLKFKTKAQTILDIVKENPFQNPPPYEKLVGGLSGAYSRRINIQHRLVYQVLENEQIIKILRLWTHYE